MIVNQRGPSSRRPFQLDFEIRTLLLDCSVTGNVDWSTSAKKNYTHNGRLEASELYLPSDPEHNKFLFYRDCSHLIMRDKNQDKALYTIPVFKYFYMYLDRLDMQR